MEKKRIDIDGVPTIIYGEHSDRVILFVHGQSGYKEEAEGFAEIAIKKGRQVISIDLPGHGERKSEIDRFVPWVVVPELRGVMEYIRGCWSEVALRANSIGAYFCMLAFCEADIYESLFVSPIVDMREIIYGMMGAMDVSEAELEEKKLIPTPFGQTLSWEYLLYANRNIIVNWNIPTKILYGENDNMTKLCVIEAFAEKFDCELTIMENGEHWFHTDEEVQFLRKWENERLDG